MSCSSARHHVFWMDHERQIFVLAGLASVVSRDGQDAVLSDRGLPQDEGSRGAEGVLPVNQYRKRPIIVSAVQWDPASPDDPPDGLIYDEELSTWFCETLEGLVKVRGGEWIVTGAKGEHYPVQDEIFKLTHLPVVEGEDTERVREEIIFAHDLIKALLAGRVPDHSPDGQQSEIWQAALNALCWVLGHDYGKVLQGNIESIHQAIRHSGLDFRDTLDSDHGHAPASGPGSFSLN